MRPRDPQCVVVFWQVDRDALDIFAESSGIGALRLRITGGLHPERPLLDDDLLLDTDHQFVVGTDAGCRYVAAIGFYSAEGSWHELVRSSPITTPVAGPTGTWTPQPPIHVTAAPLPPPSVEPKPAALPDSTEPDDDGVPPPQLRPRFRSVGFNPPDTEFQAATPMAPAGTESGREPVTDAEALNLIVWESIPYHGAPNSGEAAHWLARRPAAGP
ncbi:MAG: DUF4912 domain-containing protein, partial [Polynucleobacter sp.]|nr:DUF4912 domain-containing protein [Polynucleobacter sp.]